jgi:hypothetical protein
VLVYNEHGSVESEVAMLTVLTPANITVQPTNRMVRVRPDPAAAPNTNVSFTIVASSTTPIRLQWRFNGALIPGATNSNYTVTNVQLSHEGVYDTAVTDGAGTIFSAPAYLQPLITPVFVRTPASQEVAAGGQVTLSAAVNGHPPPFTYEWRRGAVSAITNITVATNNFYAFTAPSVPTSVVYRVVVKNLAALQPGIASVATITVQADSDTDGLPDGWEIAHNLDANNRPMRHWTPMATAWRIGRNSWLEPTPWTPRATFALTFSAWEVVQTFRLAASPTKPIRSNTPMP